MATPTIPNGETQFFTTVYSGNGAGQRVGKFVPFTDSATIAKSCMFNRADTAILDKTYGSAGTSRKKYTFSVWLKIADIGQNRRVIMVGPAGNDDGFRITNDNTIHIWQNGIVASRLYTNRTFEDTSKWYHCVMAVDTTQATDSNRIKFYVDGDLITSYSTEVYPSQDYEGNVGNNVEYTIGASNNNAEPYGGYMAEFNYVDGQALGPESFGVTDTSTGRWIPKTVEPFPTTTTDIAVTVVSSGGNKYALDGVTQGTVTLIEGATYKFDQSDSSNSGHPLRFSTTSDGTHGGGSEYTTGVTTVGTPGSAGAYTEITVATGAPTLYYYCTNHSGMGGTANTQDQYGTNGFRLEFGDSSALGDDTSGNTNDFTANNLTASDQRTDTPTNNLPTIRPYNPSYSQSFSEGNLQHATTGINVGYPVCSTLRPKGSGKYYAECRISAAHGGYTITVGCYAQEDLHNYSSGNAYPGNANLGSGLWISGTNYLKHNGTTQSNPSFTFSAGDVIGLALDLDNGTLSFYDDDNGLIGTVPYDKTKSACFCGQSNKAVTFNWNFGDNPTFDGNETAGGNADEDGNGDFFKSVPSGFKVLKQDNMAETAKGVSGLVWTKNRDAADNHQLYDSSRGKQLLLTSNTTDAESTVTDGLQKFLAGGQQIEDSDAINTAGESFVSWNWVANGGTTASNTDGSITSSVQANTTAGFSIVEYTGTGSNATVGHGLSTAPEWIWVKQLNSTGHFSVYLGVLGGTKISYTSVDVVNSSNSSYWNNTDATSSVFSVGTNADVNGSSSTYVAYCWHGVDGFSKFGSFTGNGNAKGPFVYTGFKPAWLMIKSSSHATSWYLFDNKRNPINPAGKRLVADGTFVEDAGTTEAFDFLSNGFKLRNTSTGTNGSGRTYIYMAFAEHPFVGDGTSPVTAR